METGRSESTHFFSRLTERLQRDVPDPLVALGIFQARGTLARAMAVGAGGGRTPRELCRRHHWRRLPTHVALALTHSRVYVFALGTVHPNELIDVWARTDVRATVEDLKMTWAVTVDLADGHHHELEAMRVGANRVNGEVVRLLTEQ
jgi:hypothetical protein